MRLAALFLLLPSLALAAELQPSPRMDGDAFGPAFPVAQVEKAVELVRRTRDIDTPGYPGTPVASDLRVSLIVFDTGPATDVSPTHDLHLALFNEISEYGTAWALEPISAVFAFERVERIGAGLYDVYATLLSGRDGPDCYFVKAKISVDARALSVAVRQARGLEEFEARRYTTPISVTATALGCTNPY